MEYLVILIIIVISVYILQKNSKAYIPPSPNIKKEEPQQPLSKETIRAIRKNLDQESNSEKTEKQFVVDEVLEGYYIYEDDSFFAHGVKHRFDACVTWAKGDNPKLAFKREPNNKYDSNAIAIYGISSTGRRKIGYVAAELADELVYEELDDKIKPRLLSVKIEDTPYIEYEILVKK